MNNANTAPEFALSAVRNAFRIELSRGCGIYCVGHEPGDEDIIEEWFFEVRDGRRVVGRANVSESHVEIIDA
jgi:hypothetical protein